MGEEKKLLKPEPMNFTDNGGTISFSYQFKLPNAFPVRVVADGQELLQYYIEVED